MGFTLEELWRMWPSEPWLTASLILTGGIYLRGWTALAARDHGRWPSSRPAAFGAGLAAIYLALASPLDSLAELRLPWHMVQHLLLLMIAPPLVWLGAPFMPLLMGLPRKLRRLVAVPVLRTGIVRSLGSWLTRPLVAWLLFFLVTWAWHMPRAYELALGSRAWHVTEHATFLIGALAFWFPIVRPYPSRPRYSTWILLPYLVLADLQNTVLAAWLTFSGRVLYPHYARVPRLSDFSPLDDQALAGVLMWVPGSIAFLLPMFWIGIRLMSAPRASGTYSEARRV